jgi:GH24 family phage-related lysozyme (muramidase)
MKMSQEGLRKLRGSEGIRTQVYDDANGQTISSYSEARGYPTIGIGHLIRNDEREYFSQFLGGRNRMTEKQVYDLFESDVQKHIDPWKKRVTAPVTQEMIDALASLAFNIGTNGKALNAAIAAINKEDYEAAAEAIRTGPTTSKGITMSGLVRRRNEEADLFLSGGLPTGIRLFGTQIRVLPVVLGTSVALLGFAIYIRLAQPEWASFLNRRR